MPEHSAARTITQATLLGIVSGVPGVGGAAAGLLQGAADSASRARDEEWWAMVAARVSSLERDVQAIASVEDPEFLAALHRLTRAAQETADETKRERLAAAVVHSGSWSSLPLDDRVRMERLIAELSSREVKLLTILADPRGWLEDVDPAAVQMYENKPMASTQNFLDDHVSQNDLTEQAAVRSALEALQVRALVGAFDAARATTGSAVLQSKTTGLGWELVHFLRGIGAS